MDVYVGEENRDLLNKIERAVTSTQDRVFPWPLGDEICYVKKNNKSKWRFGHNLQSLVYRITKNPFMAPTVLRPGINVTLHEARKIQLLGSLGIPVPKVYGYTENFMIIEDCGEKLSRVLQREAEQAQMYIESTVRVLGSLHRVGQCHGGAQIRNFTVKNGRINMIDFEEYVEPSWMNGIAFRDLMLFLSSAVAVKGIKIDIEKAIDAYEAASGFKVWPRVFKTTRRLKPLLILNRPAIFKHLGRDLREILSFVSLLNGIALKNQA